MLRPFLIFLLLQAGMFTLEMHPSVQHSVIAPWTALLAKFSGGFMQWIDGTVAVQGIMIYDISDGFAVVIKGGCNGVEATILLAAAMLAFPAPWRYKLSGLAAGGLSIQILNVLRIITLFYLGQWNQAVFDWAHVYAWQALIMLDAVFMFLLWIRMLPPSAAQTVAETDLPPHAAP